MLAIPLLQIGIYAFHKKKIGSFPFLSSMSLGFFLSIPHLLMYFFHRQYSESTSKSNREERRKRGARAAARPAHRHGRLLPPRVPDAGLRRLPPPPLAWLRGRRRRALSGGVRRQEHPRDLPGHHREERHLPHRAGHRVRHQHGRWSYSEERWN